VLVAGDFNDWGAKLRPAMNALGFRDFVGERIATYPARLPLAQLDFVYSRGLKPLGVEVPKGRIWWRMSDHLPLIAEFKL
jgi:endonuclease/exonuclease/phosphatase family metal-dependent hydrolase